MASNPLDYNGVTVEQFKEYAKDTKYEKLTDSQIRDFLEVTQYLAKLAVKFSKSPQNMYNSNQLSDLKEKAPNLKD